MQVIVMNKGFLLNPEKNLGRFVLLFSRKRKNRTLYSNSEKWRHRAEG